MVALSDLGCMDSDGWVYFKQRIKRMIISSGYSIYPQHIENIIDNHPDVDINCHWSRSPL